MDAQALEIMKRFHWDVFDAASGSVKKGSLSNSHLKQLALHKGVYSAVKNGNPGKVQLLKMLVCVASGSWAAASRLPRATPAREPPTARGRLGPVPCDGRTNDAFKADLEAALDAAEAGDFAEFDPEAYEPDAFRT